MIRILFALLKVSRSRNKIVEPQILPKKQTNILVFLSWTVYCSSQDGKTNSFVGFFGRIWGSTVLFWDLLTFLRPYCPIIYCVRNCQRHYGKSKNSWRSDNFRRKFLCLQFFKKRTKNFCPNRLGQKFEFSSLFFGRIKDTKISFRD